MLTKKQFSRGFTIVELIIVTIIITILTTITFIVYTKVQTNVLNATIASDAENMNSSQTLYKLSHSAQAKAYYSANGPDDDLNIKPTGNNIIDVVVSGKDYCIRVYNSMGEKNSIYNAYTKESKQGVCDQLLPSDQALNDATPSVPLGPAITVTLDGSNFWRQLLR